MTALRMQRQPVAAAAVAGQAALCVEPGRRHSREPGSKLGPVHPAIPASVCRCHLPFDACSAGDRRAQAVLQMSSSSSGAGAAGQARGGRRLSESRWPLCRQAGRSGRRCAWRQGRGTGAGWRPRRRQQQQAAAGGAPGGPRRPAAFQSPPLQCSPSFCPYTAGRQEEAGKLAGQWWEEEQPPRVGCYMCPHAERQRWHCRQPDYSRQLWQVGIRQAGEGGSHLCKQPGTLVPGGAALCCSPRGFPGRQLCA
jgi:hypothetical protein